MKVYSLTGPAGTGKSYQAMALCQEKNIVSIIDDGLFIFRNKVEAGISAKRQKTKVGAIKTALFTTDEHCDSVRRRIRELDPAAKVGLLYADGPIDAPGYGRRTGRLRNASAPCRGSTSSLCRRCS